MGSYTRAPRLLGILLLALAPTFFLTHTAGFRGSKDVRYRDAAKDSVEALGLAIVCAAGVLLLLRQVTTQTPLGPALGRVVLEAVPFAIGMALSRHFLAGAPDESQDPDEERRHSHGRLPSTNSTVADLGATAIGAIFVALNIAPTDEIQIIAATMTPAWLIGVLLASLVISYCICSWPASATSNAAGGSGAFCSTRSPRPSSATSCRCSWPPGCCGSSRGWSSATPGTWR